MTTKDDLACPAIEVQELAFSYPKAARPALGGHGAGVGFTIERGSIFGFLGPSGAGKSTTLKILCGLLHGYQGRVRVLGHEPALGRRQKGYLSRIGVAFEFPYLYERFNARENLEFFGAFHDTPKRGVMELLDELGLAAHADQRVEKYSKGMRMRLNLARALLHKPELLFLDEPTSGLDPATAAGVKAMIRAERDRGAAIFLTTHQMDVAAELCDQVAFLVDGSIALIDSPRALMLAHGKRTVKVEGRSPPDGAAWDANFDLDGLAGNEEFRACLGRAGLETIHTQEASLEDIFLKVTGRSLA